MNREEVLLSENKYLDKCKSIINAKMDTNNAEIKSIVDSIDSSLYDYFNGDIKKNIDDAHITRSDEFVQLSKELANEKSHLNLLVKENSYLDKMKNFPYFAKIKFDDEDYYIGISSLFDDDNNLAIVDWRAPIANLYYESELGDTYFKTDKRIIKGNLTLKRQFIIENSNLVDYIDSNLKIDDPLLIRELSKNSSDKLKNIVSTIQSEQNKAIKADIYKDLLVLGVAGSGKTSVAMHRVSYLIYRNNKIYNSNKIAVLSPNSFFYNYIDNILPSLGEDNVMNFDITYVIEKVLKRFNVKFKNKEAFYIDLFNDYARNKRDLDTCDKLNGFISKEIGKYIKDINIKFYSFENSHIDICNYFSSNIMKDNLPNLIKLYADSIISKVNKDCFVVSKKEQKMLFDEINHMFYKLDVFDLINKMYPNKYKRNSYLEYYDAVSLVYIILKFYDIKELDVFNHLIIDEIQDYSNVEMSIINTMFDCKKTMVGDINQILSNKFNYEFNDCNKLELLSSYRCSKEIFDFINSLVPSKETVSFMRHGNKVVLNECSGFSDEIDKVVALIQGNQGTTAIICKNNVECDKWYSLLSRKISIKKVNDKKTVCNVLIATVYECKGLEFDNVIVVDVDSNNYKHEIENNWLYIACSRAMHNLHLFYFDKVSNFITNINDDFYTFLRE